ncbi:MAG: Hpt domain-containing protein [Rhizomicrobium sp.]
MAKPADGSEPVATASYPRLLSEGARKQAMAKLKSGETLAKASRVIAMKTSELRGAVLALVEQLEAAMQAQDWPTAFSATHEIRGLAGTAGLTATGRIANGLCHYLDSIAQLGIEPDATVTNLHLGAVIRSARTEDEAAQHGDAVAEQLAALVARKLAEIKDPATR